MTTQRYDIKLARNVSKNLSTRRSAFVYSHNPDTYLFSGLDEIMWGKELNERSFTTELVPSCHARVNSSFLFDSMCISDSGVILWYTIGLIMTNQKPPTAVTDPQHSGGGRPRPVISGGAACVQEHREHHLQITNNRECCRRHLGMPLAWRSWFMTGFFQHAVCHRGLRSLVRAAHFLLRPLRSVVGPQQMQKTTIPLNEVKASVWCSLHTN